MMFGIVTKSTCLKAVLGLLFGTAVSFADSQTRIQISSSKTITPLVELYTSEGCSSCPPVDRYLSKLGKLFDQSFHAVALAFHVDYWNYLGWADPFSDARFSERQRRIAELNNQRSIYTPELVVSGKEARGGDVIYDEITEANSRLSEVHIMLEVTVSSTRELTAKLDIDNASISQNAEVFFALYENDIVRKIEAGENRGKTLHHDYVVRHLSDPMRISAGNSTSDFELGLAEDWNIDQLGLAVVVINPENGKTLQAISTPLQQPVVEG